MWIDEKYDIRGVDMCYHEFNFIKNVALKATNLFAKYL